MSLLTAKTLSRRPGLLRIAQCLHCFFDIEREQLICECASVLLEICALYLYTCVNMCLYMYIQVNTYVYMYLYAHVDGRAD